MRGYIPSVLSILNILFLLVIKLVSNENIYLHPKLTYSYSYKYSFKNTSFKNHNQYLHPVLYDILKLKPTHESSFYLLDGKGNPILLSKPSPDNLSELGQLVVPSFMLSPHEPSVVYARIFTKLNRLSVCGDGILDASNSELCEFSVNVDGAMPFVAVVPPPNYHLPWVADKKHIQHVQRDCLWAPGRTDGCSTRASTGGVHKLNVPSSIFFHYCGDGILDIAPSSILVNQITEMVNNPNSEYRQFYTICGYIDEHCLLPIYCNEGHKPWILPGKTIRFTPHSEEQCDLGELLNGAAGSGCTSECRIRCSYHNGGRVDWNDWPRLSCIQPCLDDRWTGTYCNIPNCVHGIPNSQLGGCYSCDRGWIGPSCNQNVCGNGKVIGWSDEYHDSRTRPICICKPGWYGHICDKSYCASWTNDGKCSMCIPGKRDPASFCIQDSCVYGEIDPNSGPEGACIQPCKIKFFTGKFCNNTKCLQWDQNDLLGNDKDIMKCSKCFPGYNLPLCTPSTEKEKSYSRCIDPWSFGPDCSQQRKKETPFIDECIPGWTGPYCSLLACIHGYPDFSHPHLQCIPGSCIPGWSGKWCEKSVLVLIDDLNKNSDWANARALVYKYYLYITEASSIGFSLQNWRDFATRIVSGARPTAIVPWNSYIRQADWDEKIPDKGFIRVYLPKKEKIWVHLKPDQAIYSTLESINYEMRRFLQQLQYNKLYLGAIENTSSFLDIPIQKRCLLGIESQISPFEPCVECAPGWFNDYCDETNCETFSHDHTSCIGCKLGFKGDFCQFQQIEEKDPSSPCSEGWNGSSCHIPKCLYGYRIISPSITLQNNKKQPKSIDELRKAKQNSESYISDDLSISEAYRMERTWIEKFSLCGLSDSKMSKTSFDIKMHSITKISSHSWLFDGIPIRADTDPKCSACFPGFEGEYCDKRFNENKPIIDCKEPCVYGHWDWKSGFCYPCFSGSFGHSCEKSYCLEWHHSSNFTCKRCELVNFSDINLESLSFKLISKVKSLKLSNLHGLRFGNFCEFRGLCAFGEQSKTDEGCYTCQSPCVTGVYCNETRCASFTHDSPPICASCQDGWKGPYCEESIPDPKIPSLSKLSTLTSIFFSCKSLGHVEWPACNTTRCAYGIVDPTDIQYLRCIPGSCFPGWAGPWCTFPLWKSENRSLAHQDHLFHLLKKSLNLDPTTTTSTIGLWHGDTIVRYSESIFYDIFPSDSEPKCNWHAFTGHYCNQRFCKYGVSPDDNIQECSVCFPGWFGPFCNETHRKNPFLISDVSCEEGWWNPVLCDKKSLCLYSTDTNCPSPGGIPDLYSDNCISCSCPFFFKGPYCNQTTCVHGITDLTVGSAGACKPNSCSPGWKGSFCNETICIHGYRILFNGLLIEDNVYSYFPYQRWLYGWKGIGRIVSSISPNNLIPGYYDQSTESPECTACYPGYPKTTFCDKIFTEDTSPCLHGWFDPLNECCSECFPGWSGSACRDSSCLQWLIPYVKCKECQYGLYGSICQYRDRCINGILNRRSLDGSCQQPCLFRYFTGPFCNESKCLISEISEIPALDSKGQCIKCLDGYSGPYCTISPICINGLSSVIISSSTSFQPLILPGICIPGSCSPGWSGLWCHQRTSFKPSLTIPDSCENGWKGSFCDLPDCQHGVPDYSEGYCRWCYPGWTGSACNSKPCLFGIPNLLHQPSGIEDDGYKRDLDFYSPPCVPGTCLESWRGPACAELSCFGTSPESSHWVAPEGLWHALFGTSTSNYDKIPNPRWSSTPNMLPVETRVKTVDQLLSSPSSLFSYILPILNGNTPGINWKTLQCTGCSHPYYRPPWCDRINRCVWGILDEASSDGRCIPHSCQRGGGPFCSKPICEHGIPDPIFTLGCYKCYPGWTGYSNDRQRWDSVSFIDYDTPNVFDLSYDSLPILICNVPSCVNGWMHFLHSSIIDPHSYICICFDGWMGENCDVSLEGGGFSRSTSEIRPGCPEYACPPLLNVPADCPFCHNNSESIFIVEIAPQKDCPSGTVDRLFVDLYLKEKNPTN